MLFPLFCLCLFTTQPAVAQLTLYQDEASFLAHAGPVTTETFEEYPDFETHFPGPALEINNVIYTAQQDLGSDWVISSNPVNPPAYSPSHNLVYQNITPHFLTFTDHVVYAFGFWMG